MSKKHQVKIKLMLDSGAFSAWLKGDEINIKKYIKYIKDHKHLVDSYVSLDVIPGSRGRMDRSQREIKKSAEASNRNHQIMKDAGLSPIPVFHQGENFDYLYKMLDAGETYIGISPYLGATSGEIIRWMDDCFTRITDDKGYPLIRTHGFGATGHRLMTRYPWHSVDSTSWVKSGGYGSIIVPAMKSNGTPDYSAKPLRIHITNTAVGDQVNGRGRTFELLGEGEQEWIAKFADEHGLSMADLRNDPYPRMLTFLIYFKLVEEHHNVIKFRKRAMFNLRGTAQYKPVKCDFRIIFATQISNRFQATLLTRAGIENRLLSYYLLKDLKKSEMLEEYLQKGILGEDALDSRAAPKQRWDRRYYTDYRRRALTSRFS